MDPCLGDWGGNWAYGRILCPDCPRMLLQELNVGTVITYVSIWSIKITLQFNTHLVGSSSMCVQQCPLES